MEIFHWIGGKPRNISWISLRGSIKVKLFGQEWRILPHIAKGKLTKPKPILDSQTWKKLLFFSGKFSTDLFRKSTRDNWHKCHLKSKFVLVMVPFPAMIKKKQYFIFYKQYKNEEKFEAVRCWNTIMKAIRQITLILIRELSLLGLPHFYSMQPSCESDFHENRTPSLWNCPWNYPQSKCNYERNINSPRVYQVKKWIYHRGLIP